MARPAISSICPSCRRRRCAASSTTAAGMKADGRGAARAPARRPRAGDDLRQAVDAHARLLRRRDAPARRRDDHPHRHRDAARPRRDDRRHGARALALCRCDHDPHPRPRCAAGARRARDRARHQRADAALASLPGHGRSAHLRGASRPDRRPQGRLDGRCATTCSPPGACRRSASPSGSTSASPPELAAADCAAATGRERTAPRCAS